MQTTVQKKTAKYTGFKFSAIAWHELKDKMYSTEFQEALNENLDLTTYCEKVKCLGFIFIAIRPTHPIHKEFKGYSPKYQMIEMQLKLDYHQFEAATSKEATEMKAALFLKAIAQIPSIRRLSDFNWQPLYRDVKLLFIRKGWLPDTLTIAEKAALTGLPEATITLIEIYSDLALMGDLKTYCQKLRLPYQAITAKFFEKEKLVTV